MVKRAASNQIVLGVNLEETEIRLGGQNLGEVLRFETQARPGGQPIGVRSPGRNAARVRIAGGWHHHRGRSSRSGGDDQAFFSLNAANWPKPVGEVGDAVFSQLPFGTSFQALPW